MTSIVTGIPIASGLVCGVTARFDAADVAPGRIEEVTDGMAILEVLRVAFVAWAVAAIRGSRFRRLTGWIYSRLRVKSGEE